MGFFSNLMRKGGRAEAAFEKRMRSARGEFESGAARMTFTDMCVFGAMASALDLVRLKDTKDDAGGALKGIESDVVLFEATAWFLANVQTYIRASPEVPDQIRAALAERLASARSDLGSIFETNGQFFGGRELLRSRVDQYPTDVQEGIGFFCAALMEGRGKNAPTPQVCGGPPPLDFRDGMFLPLAATSFLAGAMKPRLTGVFEFVQHAVKSADTAEAAQAGDGGSSSTPMDAYGARSKDSEIVETAKQGTKQELWKALALLTFSRSRVGLDRLRKRPELQSYLARTNADVVMYLMSALLLGLLDWYIAEEEWDEEEAERLKDRVLDISVMVGAIYERTAGFQNAEKNLSMISAVYLNEEPSSTLERFADLLLANEGRDSPSREHVERRYNVTFSEAIGAALDGDYLRLFLTRASEYIRSIPDEVEDARNDGQPVDDAEDEERPPTPQELRRKEMLERADLLAATAKHDEAVQVLEALLAEQPDCHQVITKTDDMAQNPAALPAALRFLRGLNQRLDSFSAFTRLNILRVTVKNDPHNVSALDLYCTEQEKLGNIALSLKYLMPLAEEVAAKGEDAKLEQVLGRIDAVLNKASESSYPRASDTSSHANWHREMVAAAITYRQRFVRTA